MIQGRSILRSSILRSSIYGRRQNKRKEKKKTGPVWQGAFEIDKSVVDGGGNRKVGAWPKQSGINLRCVCDSLRLPEAPRGSQNMYLLVQREGEKTGEYIVTSNDLHGLNWFFFFFFFFQSKAEKRPGG